MKGSSGITAGGGPASSTALIVEPWMPIFPARTTKTLRYSTSSTLAVTSGVPVTYVFRGNDIFDPDFTGTGHQLMGFDQMMLFYNHFCVIRSKLKVTFRSTASSTNSFMVCVRQDATSSPLTVIDRIVECGANVMDVIDESGSSGGTKILWLGLDICKLQGLSRSALTADSTLRGDAATSPTEITYYHVQCWDSNGKSGTVTMDAVLELESVFMEPRDQVQSFVRVEEKKEEKEFVHICCKGVK